MVFRSIDLTTTNSVASVYETDRIAYRSYRFSVELNATELAPLRLAPSDVRFIVATHDINFSLVELTALTVFSVVTLVFFLFWLVIYITSRKKLLPEQRWQPTMLLALFVSQRPLIIVTVLTPYNIVFDDISVVTSVIATTATLVFLICLLDALRSQNSVYFVSLVHDALVAIASATFPSGSTCQSCRGASSFSPRRRLSPSCCTATSLTSSARNTCRQRSSPR